MNRRWVQLAVAAVFLTVGIISVVNTWQLNSYIRATERRDTAQEQCITDLGVWLQDWLRWRWVDHINASNDEIISYHAVHPQPPCHIEAR